MTNLRIKTSAFFNKPSAGLSTVAQIAANADVVFSGYNQQGDISYWTNLVANGFDRVLLGHYGKFDNAHDPEAIFRPGSPESSPDPNRNTIAFETTNDMENLRDNNLAADSSTWPLRYNVTDATKNPPYGWVENDPVISQSGNVNRYVHMDIGSASYRTHFKTRFEARFNSLAPSDRPGFIWLDNGRDNPYFTGTTLVPTKQYPEADGSGWFAAALDWIDWLITNVCVPNSVGLCINLQNTGSSVVRFKQYIDVLSRLTQYGLPARTFIEFFATTSSGNYQTTLNLYKMSLEKMFYAEGHGVACDCVAQLQGDLVQSESNSSINARAKLVLASYLLAMGSQSTLRYADDDNAVAGYGYFNIPPIFTTYETIRQPIGKYYNVGGNPAIFGRDFVDEGYVEVDYTTPSAPVVTITPGVGTTKKPLLTQIDSPSGWRGLVPIYLQVFAEPQNSGTLSYALQSGTLPTNVTINASTGMISGTPPVSSNSGTATIRVSESGGGFADTTFTWTQAVGDPVPTPGFIIGINYGGPEIELANGDVFEAAIAASTTPVDFSWTLNGSTDTTTAAGLTLDSSVPDHWTDDLFADGLNDTAGSAAVVTITGITSDVSTVYVGINTGSTPTGRIVAMYFNGVKHATEIDFANMDPSQPGVTNRCYAIPYVVDTSSGTLTIEARRAATATQSSRIMVASVVGNNAPVLTDIGSKSIVIGGDPLTVALSATDPENQDMSFEAVFDPDLPGTWTADINDISNGNANLVITQGATAGNTYQVTVTVSDGTLTDSDTFQLTVFSTPEIDTIADFSMVSGKTTTRDIIITSPSDAGIYSVNVTINGLLYDRPAVAGFLDIVPVGEYEYTLDIHPTLAQFGDFAIGVSVTDNDGNQGVTSFNITVAENTFPVIDLPGTVFSMDEEDVFSLAMTISDSDGTITDASYEITPALPSLAVISFDHVGDAYTFGFTSELGDGGTYTITFSATDDVAQVTEQVVTLIINATAAPVSDLGLFYVPRSRKRNRLEDV